VKYCILLFSIFLFSLGISAQRLNGKVVDSANGQPIPGAVVYFPQLKLIANTDSTGHFSMSSMPYGTYEMEVQIVGFSTLTKQISINDSTTCNCSMCTMPGCNMNEVVITALGNITNTQRSPVPVSLVTHDMLLQNTSSTAIDALSTQPGVNETTEGVGTTKPQINGMGFIRVLTLFDGERQEDFEWGDDHGVLIDPYAIYDAEIIRGPASLEYGSNAEGGVIYFKSQPFAPEGTTQGSVLTEYQTNNGLIGNSVDVGGNHNGFVWDLRASSEETHDYRDPKDGYVWGTAWQQENARLTLGLIKKWGYSRISFSALHRRIQVPDGNRDSAGNFMFNAPVNGSWYPTKANFLAYDPTNAPDKILDEYTIWLQNGMNVGKGNIEVDLGFTESVHFDIDSGTVGDENMAVSDIPYSLKYQVAGSNTGLKFAVGTNGMYEFENNLAAPPYPYVAYYEIPNYTDLNISGYALLQWTHKNLTVSGGLRYDYINFTGQSMYLSNYATPEQQIVPERTAEAVTQFIGFNNKYTGPSGSIGATYQFPDNNYLKLNFSKSYRAPAINELSSNELNIGSNAYDLGNINLKAEQGYQVDFAYGNNGKDVSFEADGFYNYINNFIFADRTGNDSLGYPVFQFVANTAIFYGVSGFLNIHPDDTRWLEIDNGFTYVYSYLMGQSDSTKHAPWTPAPRLISEIKIKFANNKKSILKSSYIEFGAAKYWAQNNIYSALYTELPSVAYTLFNLGVGTTFINNKTGRELCSLYINCTNLTNNGYADHLNLAQYFYSINGSLVTVTNTHQGIYNMGRNVGFKLLIPFGGHKVSETKKGLNE
jgi:iron complex outermembrane recepter protein